VRAERATFVGIAALGAAGCALGLLDRPAEGLVGGSTEQLLDLVRVFLTTCMALTLVLGPGVLIRTWRRGGGPSLGFLFIPGLALMVASGTVTWLLADRADPRLIASLCSIPVLAIVLVGVLMLDRGDVFDGEERRALFVVGCVLGFAISRALWSVGPEGELYAGQISRTLEVGDRSDSRISFILPQLATHGISPHSEEGKAYFLPYDFSSRGPLAGLAATPVTLISGGTPGIGIAEQPWRPFDHQGFMAYRLTMMVLASTAFLSVWELGRRLGGSAVAWVALLLAATTPFLITEVWFTWPKLMGASLVVLGAVRIVERKPWRSGLLVGAGYLMHPSELLPLAGISLVALWPLKGARWRRPDVKALVMLALGVAVALVAWRIVNLNDYSQNNFVEYLTSNGTEPNPPLGHWLLYRLASTGNTLVPMLMPFVDAHDLTVNAVVGPDTGHSPFIIHFFFQYWTTLPFGVGIVFFPLLLISLWKAFRRWRWPVVAGIVVPFVAFAIYWGGSRTGMMREGLQAWTLVVLATVAAQQRAEGFPWFRSKWVRALLVVRVGELLFVALGPALCTTGVLVSNSFKASDTVALLGMVGFATLLALTIWTARPFAERRS
jgi:hypothetical protein